MKLLMLLAIAALAITCARENGEPEPPIQVLVPCDPQAAPGDPLACPPFDGGIDAGRDAPRD